MPDLSEPNDANPTDGHPCPYCTEAPALTAEGLHRHVRTQHAAPGAEWLPPYAEVAQHQSWDGCPRWGWRCWGEGDCEGRLVLGHLSAGGARVSLRYHLRFSHAHPGPEAGRPTPRRP